MIEAPKAGDGRTHPDREAAVVRWAIPVGAAIWGVLFALRPAGFWLPMAAGVGGLSILAMVVRGPFPVREGVRWADLCTGAAAAGVLYGAFALGRMAIARAFPAASVQIGEIYALRSLAPAWVIAALMIAVIGPGEEIFWRGLVQRGLVARYGPRVGWAASTIVYGGVHAAAVNPLLIVAALVAGGFWGYLYLRIGRIAPIVVSHVVWDLLVFLVLPFQ